MSDGNKVTTFTHPAAIAAMVTIAIFAISAIGNIIQWILAERKANTAQVIKYSNDAWEIVGEIGRIALKIEEDFTYEETIRTEDTLYYMLFHEFDNLRRGDASAPYVGPFGIDAVSDQINSLIQKSEMQYRQITETKIVQAISKIKSLRAVCDTSEQELLMTSMLDRCKSPCAQIHAEILARLKTLDGLAVREAMTEAKGHFIEIENESADDRQARFDKDYKNMLEASKRKYGPYTRFYNDLLPIIKNALDETESQTGWTSNRTPF